MFCQCKYLWSTLFLCYWTFLAATHLLIVFTFKLGDWVHNLKTTNATIASKNNYSAIRASRLCLLFILILSFVHIVQGKSNNKWQQSGGFCLSVLRLTFRIHLTRNHDLENLHWGTTHHYRLIFTSQLVSCLVYGALFLVLVIISSSKTLRWYLLTFSVLKNR